MDAAPFLMGRREARWGEEARCTFIAAWSERWKNRKRNEGIEKGRDEREEKERLGVFGKDFLEQ